MDAIIVVAGFIASYGAFPFLQGIVVASGLVPEPLLLWLAVPDEIAGGQLPGWEEALWPVLLMVPTVLFSVELLGGYGQLRAQSRTRLFISSTLGPVLGLAVVTMVLYALKVSSASRLLIFSGTAFVGLGLFAYRLAVATYQRRAAASGRYVKQVLLVGAPEGVRRVSDHMRQRLSPTDYVMVGYLVPPGEAAPDGDPALTCLGSSSDLSQLLIHQPVQEIVVVQSDAVDVGLTGIVEACDYYRVTLRIVPIAFVAPELRDLQLASASATGLPEIVLLPRGLNSDAMFVKRLFDVFASSLLLVLLAPLFALVALAIKLTTPNLPVFYPWRVIGFKGLPFTGYKFTTMVAEAESLREALLDKNEMSGPVFKIQDDPRTTRLGKFLRKYSLNELPQLWSVLIGDMSLVGPRPAFRHELERYELWHKRKLSIKPGITCLWQVRGRNTVSKFDDWVAMDLEYIDRWSLWLDMKILFRTVTAVVRGTGS
ncbi:MAG: exopolysaccharide biosynthesis polyprenyl glycosylphosphotransferase [Vicinamibacterales bacterium]|jgi:exopolysaccharide biosynthesis polyprenyl glycosylphosphotransferase